jgi:DNA-binding CsgD family transcriptional regulator
MSLPRDEKHYSTRRNDSVRVLTIIPHLGVAHGMRAPLLFAPLSNSADMGHTPGKGRSTRRLSEASLRSRFHLTPAEAQIALGIACGRTLAAIAEARGACVSTARTQLKCVFAKTGTHRQAELVALLAGPRAYFRGRRP